MPKYRYRCKQCGKTGVILHSISVVKTNCLQVFECEKEEEVENLPSSFSFRENNDAGKLVKKTIEETKQEIKELGEFFKERNNK